MSVLLLRRNDQNYVLKSPFLRFDLSHRFVPSLRVHRLPPAARDDESTEQHLLVLVR